MQKKDNDDIDDIADDFMDELSVFNRFSFEVAISDFLNDFSA